MGIMALPRLRLAREARPGPAASSFEGDFYVVGTNDASGRATGERYVAPRGRWEALPVMRQGRERCAAAVVGGSLYVCGGVEKVGHGRGGVAWHLLRGGVGGASHAY